MRVRMVPDSGSGLGVTEFEIKHDARRHPISFEVPKVAQVASEDVVPANVAAQGVDVFVAARHLKLPEEHIVDHFRGWFGPPPIFIGSIASPLEV